MLKSGLFRGNSGLPIILVFIAVLSAAHVLTRTAMYGIIQVGDAMEYMEFARSLAAGDGFKGELKITGQSFDNVNFRVLTSTYQGELLPWPPLFSVVLAFFRFLGVEFVDIGRYLNAISFGLIILIIGHWLYRHIRFQFVIVCASIAAMISYPFPRISSWLYTGSLFILVALLALVQMELFLGGKTAKSGFWLSIVFSASAPLIRWMGVTVILTGALLILTHKGTPTLVKWKRTAFYSAASSLPLTLWLARNWILSGTLTGPDIGSRQSHWDTLSQFGDILYMYAFVRQEPGWIGVCLWAVAVLIVIHAIILFASRQTRVVALQKIRGSYNNSTVRPVFPFVTFIIIYSATLIIILPYGSNFGIESRYVAVIYAPAIVAVAVWLDRLLLAVHQSSGASIWTGLRGIRYNQLSDLMAIMKWLIIGLVFTIFVANSTRNIVSYIEVLIAYNPLQYQF